MNRDEIAEKIFLLDYERVLSALDRTAEAYVKYTSPEHVAHLIEQMARISYVMADLFLTEKTKQHIGTTTHE